MKRLIAWLVLGSAVAFLGGCNTVEGLGKDVKAAGSGIEKAAEKTKPY
jgi:predicted small secreted protein